MNAHPLILVVDDDREIRTLLSEYLAGNGFRTAEAADGTAMWKALDAARVDLIVLDLMMPGEDGFASGPVFVFLRCSLREFHLYLLLFLLIGIGCDLPLAFHLIPIGLFLLLPFLL